MENTQNNYTEDTGLENGTNFMDEVQMFMIYKIAIYMNTYWFPILVPIGLVGNTLSFLVMIKPNNRKMSTCIYMAGISINDNTMMILALFHYLINTIKIHEPNSLWCKVMSYLILLVVQNSTFQVLAMTFDKYIAIKWPHKAATYSTPNRAKRIVLGIYIFVLIYNIPIIFMTKFIRNNCISYANHDTVTKVHSWFTFVINAIVPLILLCYMNYVIVQKVRQSHRMFGAIKSIEDIQSNQRSGGQNNENRQNKIKNTENQLTIMLLLVTTLFVILMIPSYIRFLYTPFIKGDTPSKYANLTFLLHLSHKLYNTNNGINFFLYCISGQKFRNDLKEILTCGAHETSKRERSVTNLTEISNVS